jgi:hypothetical protein
MVSNQRWLQRAHCTVRPEGPIASGSTAYRALQLGQVTCMLTKGKSQPDVLAAGH